MAHSRHHKERIITAQPVMITPCEEERFSEIEKIHFTDGEMSDIMELGDILRSIHNRLTTEGKFQTP
jgi:hypothetical protein